VAVDNEVFERTNPALPFRGFFATGPGREVAVRLYKTEIGEIVGFNLVRIFEVRLGQRTYHVLRTTAAMKREFRGRAVIGFSVETALRQRVRHPLATIVMFEAMTHPASYSQVARFVRTMYPRFDRGTPKRMRELLGVLAERFELHRED